MCSGEPDEENPVCFDRRIARRMVQCNIKLITGYYQLLTDY
jgi:hypothetical protein